MQAQPNMGPQAGLRSADGRPIDVRLSETPAGRDLSQVIKPGEVLSGRVIEQFANGAYLFNLRGRHLIASSQSPLLRDSVVRFQVVGNPAEGLHLRLMQADPGDRAATSNSAQRLQHLQLPASSQRAALALQLFEDLGAPLHPPARLQAAVRSGEGLSGPAFERHIASHALAARSGLPATPGVLAIAEQALRGQLPNISTPLRHVASMPPAAPTTNALHTPSVPVTAPTPGPTRIVTSGSTPAQPPPPQSANPSTLPPQSDRDLAPLLSSLGFNQASSPASEPSSFLNGKGMLEVLRAFGLRPGGDSNPSTTNTAAPATNPTGHSAASTMPTPDSARSGLPLTSLFQTLGDIFRQNADTAQPPAPTPEATHLPLPTPGDSEGGRHAALLQAGRETLADLLFRPTSLDDYDVVLPLPLPWLRQDDGARLALAQRGHPDGGSVTYVRVDIELEALGPLSLRLSGGEGGPMSITLLATGQGLRAIEAGLEDLEADLAALHIDAVLRSGDLMDLRR